MANAALAKWAGECVHPTLGECELNPLRELGIWSITAAAAAACAPKNSTKQSRAAHTVRKMFESNQQISWRRVNTISLVLSMKKLIIQMNFATKYGVCATLITASLCVSVLFCKLSLHVPVPLMFFY